MQRLVLALFMGLAWMSLTLGVSLGNFIVGAILSFAILTLISSNQKSSTLTLRQLPQQLLAATMYTLILFRDIYLSSIDVAKRVIDPAMPLNSGIIAVSTQYTPTGSDGEATADTIAAISAHGITITPGELVVDFDGNQVMYVHCLDVVASSAVAESNQAKRLVFLRRIFL
ncbi:MAG: Na+/H+ antiporter subunit E [Chloroflexota bacterium]